MTIEERANVKFPIHSDKEMEEEYIKPMRESYIAHCKEQEAIDNELLKRVHKGVLDKAIKEKKELIRESKEYWNRVLVSLGVNNYDCATYLAEYNKAMGE